MKRPLKISALLIDADRSPTISVIRCLSESKTVCLHLLSADSKSPLRFSSQIATFTPHRSRSADEWQDAILKTIEDSRAELLLASSIIGTEFLIRRADQFRNIRLMKLPALTSFETANDKWLFHLMAQACGAASPLTWPATDQDSLNNAPFPLLLKPRIGEGGRGIIRLNSPAELAARLRLPNLNRENHILQQFIPGKDLGCSVFCKNGKVLAWTAQEAIKYEKREFAPALASRFCTDEGALAQAAKVVERLHWTGVANFDMRIRSLDSKLFVLEMNPRFWQSIHGSLRAGVDFVSLNCSLPPLAREVLPINYYQGYRALPHFLIGHATDFGCRLRDPLPDLIRRLSSRSSP